MSRGRKKYIAPNVPQKKSVKHPEYRTLDVYAHGRKTEDLYEIRRALAKQANQRIVRLERAKSAITGEAFNQFGAITDVYAYLGHRNRNRFSEVKTTAMTDAELRHEIVVLQGFLGRKSSTVSGMKAIEKKRIATFEGKGIKFANTKEFYDFLNSKTFGELTASGFTSEQIVEIYDKARQKKNADDVAAEMQKALDEFRAGEKKATLKNLQKDLGVTIIKPKG